MNYEQQAKDFLSSTGSELKMVFVATVEKAFPGDRGRRNKYQVVLTRGGDKGFGFEFFDSIFNTMDGKKPSKYDILSCLDPYFEYKDMWEFANELGYVISNKKSFEYAQSVYNEAKRQSEKLQEMYSTEELQRLAEIV